MPTAVLTPSTETLLAAWRAGDGDDNPAGPLFLGGAGTERDLVNADFLVADSVSLCSGSHTIGCC
ncbi:MAG: DUF6229 family protein [Frankiaceae bacterium]